MPSLLSSAKKKKYFVVVAASFTKSSVFVCLHETEVTENDIVFKLLHFGERFQFFRSHRKRYHRFHRFCVNRRPKRKNIFADSLTPVSCKRGQSENIGSPEGDPEREIV